MSNRLKPLDDNSPDRPIAEGTRIGHVHLKVADLERALSFYCGVLGFDLMQRRGNRSLRPVAITITSGSTPGRAPADLRLRRGRQGCIIWPFSIPRGPHSPMHCAD